MSFAVVFDLDGTIIDSTELHALAFKYAVKKLGYRNYNELYKKFRKYIGLPLEEIIEKLNLNLNKRKIRTLKRLKTIYFLKNLEKIKQNKKIINLLKKLKENGFKLGIFSSSPKYLGLKILKRYGLIKYFDVLVFKEDVKKAKPSGEGLIKIKKKLKTEKIVFIGDTLYDKLSAEEAKVKFLFVKEANMKSIYRILGIH